MAWELHGCQEGGILMAVAVRNVFNKFHNRGGKSLSSVRRRNEAGKTRDLRSEVIVDGIRRKWDGGLQKRDPQ